MTSHKMKYLVNVLRTNMASTRGFCGDTDGLVSGNRGVGSVLARDLGLFLFSTVGVQSAENE